MSSAREITDLLDQVQDLEDAVVAASSIRGDRTGSIGADLQPSSPTLERRLVVRASNALGRNPLTGRAVRTLGILRRDWKEPMTRFVSPGRGR